MSVKTQFKPGASGNPAGRPKGCFSFKKELEGKVSEICEKDYLKRTYGRIIVDKAVNMAMRGTIRAIGELLDRLLGRPAQGLTLDANLNVSREQRLANIDELLLTLPALPQPDGSGDPKSN
jgi:Family of unknown function (DUF5681)